jgi:predicted DNA-binding transcriptional regulator YafY
MPEPAVTQFARLVELISWMSQSDSDKHVSYAAAAKRLGCSTKAVRSDLDILVAISEELKPWLSSLWIGLEPKGFVVRSRGSFRRPMRLTGEEALTLLVAVTGVRGGTALATKIGAAIANLPHSDGVENSVAVGPEPGEHLERVLALVRQGRDEHHKLEITYCASGAEPARRVVHVHQVVHAEGRWYAVAWCEKVSQMRRFRADRILDARLLTQDFRPQVTFKPIQAATELLQSEDVVRAEVAFSARIARWLEERYPGGRKTADGRYVVTFTVADPAWFVREVLQYGVEAEVLGPEGLREAVRRVAS